MPGFRDNELIGDGFSRAWGRVDVPICGTCDDVSLLREHLAHHGAIAELHLNKLTRIIVVPVVEVDEELGL